MHAGKFIEFLILLCWLNSAAFLPPEGSKSGKHISEVFYF